MKKDPLPDCCNPSSTQNHHSFSLKEGRTHPRREKEMRIIQKRIRREFKRIKGSPSWGKSSFESVFKLVDLKTLEKGVRGYFALKIYEYICYLAQRDNTIIRSDLVPELFATHIPFLSEAVMTLLYLDNQILDGKGGVTNQKAIGSNVINGRLLKRYLNNYYPNSLSSLSKAETNLLKEFVDDVVEIVTLGQRLEKEDGTYEAFKRITNHHKPSNYGLIELLIPYEIIDSIWQEFQADLIPHKHKTFVREYIKRVYMCNAALFVKVAELIMNLIDFESPERTNILKFSVYYGTVIQFVNDNNDYLPMSTVEKNEDNVFPD